jgi:hypothetical protein
MENIIRAIKSSLESKNYYGALFVALSAPDICGYLESPADKSQVRYEKWFERYILDKYSFHIGPSRTLQVFLSPSDCYALRCALLHEGREEIIEQHAREALDRFHFIEPPQSGSIHCNQFNNVLQLQVDIFCQDIVNALHAWLEDTKENKDIQQRLNSVLKVYPSNQVPGISIG